MDIDTMDLVSVIVPFLNGSSWLIEALQSVLHQTYTNWELIVIDDGSLPYHSQVAREFCKQYPDKIIYTEHKGHVNKGVSASRNEAAKLARGKYLAFLDADDKWLPDKLEKQLLCFTTHPHSAMVCESIIMWYSWQDETAPDYIQPVGVCAGKCYSPRTLTTLLYPFTESAPPAPSGFMVKKEAFERVGGFEPCYNGIYELYEDQAFLAKMYLTQTVHVADSANVMYRKREDSMSSAANNIERYHTVRAFYFDWLENYMDTNQISDSDIYYLLRKARGGLTQAQLLQSV